MRGRAWGALVMDSMWPGVGAIRRKEHPAPLSEWLREPHQNVGQTKLCAWTGDSHTQWGSSTHIKGL